MTTVETLRAAKAELLLHGWTRGTFENSRTGELCALGAINRALKGVAWSTAFAWHPTTRCLQHAIGDGNHIAQWNDAQSRTPEDVLAAFDAAIEFALLHESGSACVPPALTEPVAVGAVARIEGRVAGHPRAGEA